jgi:hypothetical protein
MWYTHYWRELELQKYPEELVFIFNDAYRDFLRSWVTIEWKHINLLSVFMNADKDSPEFDEHFHEYATWASWEPILFTEDLSWSFCKTARKSYDVAVVLTLLLASIILNKNYSSDGRVVHTFKEVKIYLEEELADDYEYNLEQLESLFDIWMNRCISYMDEHQEEMQQIEDEKQYDRICDLPDHELEYIAKQIAEGVTSIYLNNWQIVDVSFR